MLTSGTQNEAVHGAGVRLGNSAWWSSGRGVRREEEEGNWCVGPECQRVKPGRQAYSGRVQWGSLTSGPGCCAVEL